MEKTLKAYFRHKPFKSMKDLYVPVPVRKGSLKMEEVIARMNYRATYDIQTIAVLINKFHQTAMDLAADGYNVDAGLVYLRAMITGTSNDHLIDRKRNKVVISAIPGKELQKAGDDTKIEVTRLKNIFRGISGISVPNRTDTNIFEKSMLEISGNHLKIVGDPNNSGIRFIHTETKETLFVPANYVVYNYPKKLMIKLPDELKAGTYRLQIKTFYSGNSRLLKQAKTYEHSNEVVIQSV